MSFKLKRYENNPIISPNPDNEWESHVTTNPAAWIDENTGEVNMLYRAAGGDIEHKVYFGLATSKDGKEFTRVSDKPVLGPSKDGFDAGCVEDPRVVKFGKHYFITYATRPFAPGQYWIEDEDMPYRAPKCPDYFPTMYKDNLTTTGLLITEDFKSFHRAGFITDPTVDDRDVILFPEKINGKYWMLRRPMDWCGEGYDNEFPGIWISSGDDILKMENHTLLAKGKFEWENGKIGANTPPIKTKDGWLFLHHARSADSYYRLGAILLDLNDPTKVLHRTPDFIMEPETDYEFGGYYDGCIFPCGTVVKDGILHVYYGGADKYVGLATCSVDSLLEYLKSCPE